MTYQTKREKQILKSVVSILSQDLKPRRIFLFGSRAKGDHDAHSDFDFAVDGQAPRSHRLEVEVNQKIEKVAGLYGVDVVYLPKLARDFRQLVLDSGKIVYEKK